MIEDILLFLWIFIFPILAWGIKLFSSPKKKKQKTSFSQKKVLGNFLLLNAFLYTIILPMIFSPPPNFSEIVNSFCMFQITAFDVFFLYTFFWGKKVPKIFDKGPFSVAFLGVIFFLLVRAIIFIGIIYFHILCVWDIFVEQKVPLILIVFILLFNPVFMFYQLKERLFKND